MKRTFVTIAIACALMTANVAWAHRLDEYLHATIISLEPGRVSLTMRLVPGVAVSHTVIADIDRDGNGVLSAAEQQAYTSRVMSDLVLEEDGRALHLHLDDVSFPEIAQMQAGVGEITLKMAAPLPLVQGEHQLTFDDRHKGSISVYLVNALVPQDPNLQIEAQDRNQNQSIYKLTFSQSVPGHVEPGFRWSGFAGAFHLGMRHIAEGTDHLLFLLTLLLPAPLLALGGRWTRPATVRASLLHILGIVTAFTLGHSFTLALSAFGLVRLPGRPVEVLIAVSILVSAIHALRPIFPGKEAAIAAFFGLIHGLAFASALNELGMTGWYRLVSLLGFNLGIEAMQLVVVLVTLPSLLLLSRTRWYALLRVPGALLSAFAATVWIVERVRGREMGVSAWVEQLAAHGKTMAAVLFLCSALAWVLHRVDRASGEERTSTEEKETATHALLKRNSS